MGLPLRSPVAKLSCEAATEENAKRRSFMPRTQVTGKANFSPGITSGLPVTRFGIECESFVDRWKHEPVPKRHFDSMVAQYFFRLSTGLCAPGGAGNRAMRRRRMFM